jgi:DNA helicase-2/ATP-dependent DNA helicase PcrA
MADLFSTPNRIMQNEAYLEAIKSLNDDQRKAIDAMEGPVLVVAGPGTGKTQLLAARIGNILIHTDTAPNEILCLTYTDAGSIAMRQRLLKFIGPEAYKVQIFTYHAFCNSIIQENIEQFGGYRNLDMLTELEQVDVLHGMIDELDQDNILRRLKGQIYFEAKRMKDLFGIMKKENWSADYIKEKIEAYKLEIYEDPEFQYKRKYTNSKTGITYQKGDPKESDIHNKLRRLEPLSVAVTLLEEYNEKLRQRERFDYDDMILWVLDAFKKNDQLLARYQERYQYILVDEYQDTNGSQNDLIFSLADYWAKPNLFVVGDDDQSIYRFQGANMDNIVHFKQKYDPKVIILKENYRSSQEILDLSKALIERNEERLVNKYPEYSKHLKQAKTKGLINMEPIIMEFYNSYDEETFVCSKIMELHESGADLSEVAVIYPKHSNAEKMVRFLTKNGIPLNLKRKLNVLELAEARKIISILRYLHEEFREMHKGEYLLFDIFHYSNFGLSAKDIARFSIYCSKRDESGKRPRWRDLYDDSALLREIGIKDVDAFLQVGNLLENWITAIPNYTVQMLIEKIYTDGGILEQALTAENVRWQLQILNTFLDFVKDESAKNPLMDLAELLRMIEKMEISGISMPIQKIIHIGAGVNFLTAHSSKGLEFEYVFIINATEKNWIKSRAGSGQYTFPQNLTLSSRERSIEDDRRLFYVAMTRAKSYLYISYPAHDEQEKELSAANFIPESLDGDLTQIKQIQVDETAVLAYTALTMMHVQLKGGLFDHAMIDQALENYSMSVTALNKYLRCPVSFYFENILRVPSARYPGAGFGNAVHYALEQFFMRYGQEEQKEQSNKEKLLWYFEKGMEIYKSHFNGIEFENHLTHGRDVLSAYYDKYAENWDSKLHYKVEHHIRLTEHKGIPINGKIDKLIIHPNNEVEVFDYKTGVYKSKNTKPVLGDEDPGGDYWRQIVFYRMLIDSDPIHDYHMVMGVMDYIEPDKDTGEFKRVSFDVSAYEIELVEQQLASSYEKIIAHEFSKGCNEPECKWCNFVHDHEQFIEENNN